MEDETGEVERLRCPEYIRYRQGNVGSGWEEAGAADQRDLSYGTELVISLKNPIIHVHCMARYYVLQYMYCTCMY